MRANSLFPPSRRTRTLSYGACCRKSCGKITSLAQLRENAAIAANFQPFSTEQLTALEKRCLPATESDKYQPYRKWLSYRDGDAALASHSA